MDDQVELNQFLKQLTSEPTTIEFTDTMAVIDALYDFTPSKFTNGDTVNEAGTNNGSCKIFAFGQDQGFTVEETLACFGAFYRSDVLENPQGTDHANIRNFMITGWKGVEFSSQPLIKK
ncbi:type III effector [Vibrio astriarenae]|uniref:Type III effector n=1 Tax=Vibrio astriarenae TaxID=1481923 RepID=A0A7Z2T6D2_9VIBR|nr:type III effector [Vibrio astriarenae]